MLLTHFQKQFQNTLFILFLALILHISTSSSSSSFQPSTLGVFMVRSPESIVAPHGDEVFFECQLNLAPDRLEWRFRPLNSKSNSNDFIYLQKNDGYNISIEDLTSNLRILVSTETLGEYQCVAWFGSSAISSITAKLTLATIGLGEKDTRRGSSKSEIFKWTVSPNNFVLIKCGNVISNPPAVWHFYKDNVALSQSAPQISSGALILNSVTSRDSGIYSCSAANAITGTEIKLPNKVQLIVENTSRSAPRFLVEPPKKFSTRPGQSIILECPGVGNPPPKAIWSRPQENLATNRTVIFDYGLQLLNVSTQDRGTYVCRLDNGISPVLIQTIHLEVLEQPDILKGPQATLTNESDSLELECVAKGSPTPEIYWMINGADTRRDPSIKRDGNKLIIKSIEKKHAGIVQCFAKNELGEANESNLLQVNPKQIPGEVGSPPLGTFPTKSTYDHPGKQNKGRKKHKMPNMIPPSRPNVTRLNDDSVMIRWFVPENDGLPIQFFKVQYRMLGNPSKNIPRENWQTTNEDIPSGKRSKNHDGIRNFTSAVSGLKPDRFYRFRILAVYSNNDNKEGISSGKFLLQRAAQLGIAKSHIAAPVLTKIESISETAIILHWTFPENTSNPIDGFYAYYRPASTADEYLKATVDGMRTRYFKIAMLEPGTAYEFKLQSFTSSTASEFSLILTGMTKKPATTPPSLTPSVISASESSQDNNSFLPVIAGAVGGGFLLLVAVVVAYFCVKKRKNSQREDENKAQLDHIQADASHFVSSNVIGSQHHKPSHRMNGAIQPRMNITPNPLAQESDKNRNVMELRFMPTTTGGGLNQHQQLGIPTTTTSSSSTIPSLMGQSSVAGLSINQHEQQQHHQHNYHNNYHLHQQHSHHQQMLMPPPSSPTMHHAPVTAPTLSSSSTSSSSASSSGQSQQNNNKNNNNNNNNNNHQHHNSSSLQQTQHHHNFHYQPPLTPNMEQHRRTLERSARNLHYSQQAQNALDSIDGISTTPATRIPSLRRTRRTSGSTNNNNGGGGIGVGVVVPGSPRVQRSPMPVRAIKRNRLGHTENMSSGSLNSIEV